MIPAALNNTKAGVQPRRFNKLLISNRILAFAGMTTEADASVGPKRRWSDSRSTRLAAAIDDEALGGAQ
jgi:hypothetical protein